MRHTVQYGETLGASSLGNCTLHATQSGFFFRALSINPLCTVDDQELVPRYVYHATIALIPLPSYGAQLQHKLRADYSRQLAILPAKKNHEPNH